MKNKAFSTALSFGVLIAGAVPAMALNTSRTAANRQNQNRQQRTVTREQWRGDLAEFDRLDVNRDGVLTADEMRRGRGNRGARNNNFRGMDRNGDGVITRDEWRGDDNSFQKHDRNGDGVISQDEMRGNGKGRNRQR